MGKVSEFMVLALAIVMLVASNGIVESRGIRMAAGSAVQKYTVQLQDCNITATKFEQSKSLLRDEDKTIFDRLSDYGFPGLEYLENTIGMYAERIQEAYRDWYYSIWD